MTRLLAMFLLFGVLATSSGCLCCCGPFPLGCGDGCCDCPSNFSVKNLHNLPRKLHNYKAALCSGTQREPTHWGRGHSGCPCPGEFGHGGGGHFAGGHFGGPGGHFGGPGGHFGGPGGPGGFGMRGAMMGVNVRWTRRSGLSVLHHTRAARLPRGLSPQHRSVGRNAIAKSPAHAHRARARCRESAKCYNSPRLVIAYQPLNPRRN